MGYIIYPSVNIVHWLTLPWNAFRQRELNGLSVTISSPIWLDLCSSTLCAWFLYTVFIPSPSGYDEEHKYELQSDLQSESGSGDRHLCEVLEDHKSVPLLKIILVFCAIVIILLFIVTVALCYGCKRCVLYEVPNNRLFVRGGVNNSWMCGWAKHKPHTLSSAQFAVAGVQHSCQWQDYGLASSPGSPPHMPNDCEWQPLNPDINTCEESGDYSDRNQSTIRAPE